MMKRAFTLVEMLVVVAILAILMTIVFRLGNFGSGDTAKSTTIIRMQRIENCLSGYYAAFGSYPPVKVHGYRNYKIGVNEAGDQDETETTSGTLVWNSVEAACRSQPFGCECPPSTQSDDSGKSEEDLFEEWSQEVADRMSNGDDDYSKFQTADMQAIFGGSALKGADSGKYNEAFESGGDDWKVVKLFKFGVMSYLLPRYLFMMGGDPKFYGTGDNDEGGALQWTDNNDRPCNPMTGQRFDNWQEIITYAQTGKSDEEKNSYDLAKLANVPSQAVCARWMPNLEGICETKPKTKKFFGIKITLPEMGDYVSPEGGTDENGKVEPPCLANVHKTRAGLFYVNASITVKDGWGNEFYYYSPAPYQSYIVWSAGKNGKTFPPWMDVNTLVSEDRETAAKWKSDDIMQMSH